MTSQFARGTEPTPTLRLSLLFVLAWHHREKRQSLNASGHGTKKLTMPIESSLLQKPKKLSVQLALIVCTFGTGFTAANACFSRVPKARRVSEANELEAFVMRFL